MFSTLHTNGSVATLTRQLEMAVRAGCTECRGIAYHGRVGVFELLTMNADLRRLINARASEDEILTAARASHPCFTRSSYLPFTQTRR